MEPVSVIIAAAIGQGLAMVGKGLLEQAVPELLVEPIRQPLERLVRRGYQKAGEDRALREAVRADIGPHSMAKRTLQWVLEMFRETMQDLDPETKRPHDPPRTPVRTRYNAGKVLDKLGWLPDDLHRWVRCPSCADNGGDLMVMKYPVTNAQFERFIQAGGYENPTCWGGEEGEGWRWCVRGKRVWSSAGTDEPEYWHNPRFGQERRGYPVVGVSWYEAMAYATWLTELLRRAREGAKLADEDRVLVADLLEAGTVEVRLPTEAEWERMAGGVADKDRYPWDPPSPPPRGWPPGRREEERAKVAILTRANTRESGLGATSPVAMYPLGESQPYGLMDLAGNVWEWTATEEGGGRVLRGGSWYNLADYARCAARYWHLPDYSDDVVGFRLVSPVVSGRADTEV